MRCKECKPLWVEVSDGVKICICPICHERSASFNVLHNIGKLDQWTNEAIEKLRVPKGLEV